MSWEKRNSMKGAQDFLALFKKKNNEKQDFLALLKKMKK